MLRETLSKYCGTKRNNFESVPGTTLIVLLDGDVDSQSEVFSVLEEYSNLDNNYIQNHTQLAISFIQIGNDRQATEFLEKLDNELKVDICDTKKEREINGDYNRLLYDAIFD